MQGDVTLVVPETRPSPIFPVWICPYISGLSDKTGVEVLPVAQHHKDNAHKIMKLFFQIGYNQAETVMNIIQI
ncbi:hypothetical protein [Escherichia coli]|uniref:hypothetical protein n=1 Tax=Escherichia coli TaxID=562 RepID=UPI001372571E|nr:hypothetical protein [Escherichia coli]